MLKELRCKGDKCAKNGKEPKLLGQGYLVPGSVLEIKCPRCGDVTGFVSAVPDEEEPETK
jgi:phage FluMu protein Com